MPSQTRSECQYIAHRSQLCPARPEAAAAELRQAARPTRSAAEEMYTVHARDFT